MKKFLLVLMAVMAVLVVIASAMLVYVEENGWSYSIHKYPVIGRIIFDESGRYCTPSHCITVVLYSDSVENPDKDCYWNEPELNIWAHYEF